MQQLAKYLLIVFGLWPWFVQGQEVAFYASLNAWEVVAGSYFEVRFTLENASGKDFSAPDFEGLNVVSGPAQSSQISIVNGQRSQKLSYGYTLMAKKPGRYSIGPASIRVGNKSLKTKEVLIEVLPASTTTGKADSGKDFFVLAELSDSIAFPGQQVLLRYVLYTTRQIRGYNFLSFPSFDGFYSQEIDVREGSEIRVIDGREYQSQPLKTIALFPQRLGDLAVEAVQISLGLVSRGDPFSFFGSSRNVPVTSNSAMVRVIPLPDGAPESFKGAIGNYKMETSINSRTVTTDDALNLKVSIQGNGLAKFIEAPDLDLGTRFEVYDPRVVEEKVFVSNDDVISRKVFEYLVVPMETGRQNIQVAFSYFDTDSNLYQTLNSPMYTIDVSAGKEQKSHLTPEQMLEKYQLRPPDMHTGMHKGNNWFFGSFTFWILLALLAATMPVLYGIKWYQVQQGKIDPLVIKRSRAMAEARKRLSLAAECQQRKEIQPFYKAISDALQKYVADKFSVETKDFTRDHVRGLLGKKEVDPLVVERYLSLLERCERALFSGSTQDASQEIYDESAGLIRDLETILDKKPRK